MKPSLVFACLLLASVLSCRAQGPGPSITLNGRPTGIIPQVPVVYSNTLSKWVPLYSSDGQAAAVAAGSGSSGGSTTARTAQGGYFAPTASTNGTELANRPAANATSGVRFEISSGASITYYIGTTGTTPSATARVHEDGHRGGHD